MDEGPFLVTRDGYELLEKEIDRAEKDLHATSQAKGEAYESGGNGWHDNAAWEELSRQEKLLHGTLLELYEKRRKAEVVLPPEDATMVVLGTRVMLEPATGPTRTFIISDPLCADLASGVISYQSMLGKALLHKKAGDTVQIPVKGDPVEYTIVSIEAA